MNPNDLNSRQRSVMRYMFDKDAPAQAVTIRGIEECAKLGLIRIGGCNEMSLTAKGEAMKPHFTPPTKEERKAQNKAWREERKAKKARRAAKKSGGQP